MTIKVPVLISYDSKGSKQAIKGIDGIGKAFKKTNLARRLTFAAMGASLAVFTKKTIAATLADDKAQKTLNQTLKNLGLTFAALPVNTFIDKLQRATGVSEELLRPAMQKLVRATGDVTKAQELLNLSLDISASTGKSVEATSAALAKAYLGQTQSLGRLGIGLTKAELSTLSMEQITKKLTGLFAGQAAVAANSYSGVLGRLNVAAQEASETIGYALIESLVRLGDDKGIGSTADGMQLFADNTANAILGVSRLIDNLNTIPVAGSVFDIIKNPLGKTGTIGGIDPNQSVFGMLGQFETNARAKEQAAIISNTQSPRATEQAAIKAGATAKKISAKALADAKKLLLLKKQSAAADKLKAIFDMDLIQLTAAKQGKLSAEELARVNALIALKTTGKADDLTALNALEAAQAAAADAEIKRQNDILAVHKKNAAEILALNKANASAYADFVKTFTYPGGLFAGTPLAPTLNNATNAAPTPTLAPAIPSIQSIINSEMAIDRPFMPGDPGYTGTAGQMQPAPNVTVNLQGGINIGSQYEFYESVWRAIENSNTFGNSLNRAGTG